MAIDSRRKVIVMVGSFDPFHLGHLETILMTRDLYPGLPTVILPNNPTSKVNRSPLLHRAHWLGLVFPLWTNFGWLNGSTIAVDTRPVQTVLEGLKSFDLIGILGSDIVQQCREKSPNAEGIR